MSTHGRKIGLFLAMAMIIVFATVQGAEAGAIRAGFDANILPANDDSSTGPVPIGFTVDFLGFVFENLYVNNNGNVTFDRPLHTFTPFDLTSTGSQIIAPFFADVDTRGAPADGTGVVTYGSGVVNTRTAFGVNWVNVKHYYMGFPTNSFQLLLIDRADIGFGDFDIEFNYDTIAWESGQASGGDYDGLGGYSARVGYSNGTGAPGTFFELPGSAVNGALLDSGTAETSLINNRLNSEVPGRYVFAARNGHIHTVPEPSTLLLFGIGLIGTAFCGWKHHKRNT